ncbi:hypothetical protein OUZ56_019608 [Daphnia magna]|uniref:Uncharacterized protein n=1 Tax=Daphnia magna TaxID=35525 RepID=A0ABQ9ZD44_9CRUS|nr:hypothetical protein OUZ56_019608 [Daphnia magna]
MIPLLYIPQEVGLLDFPDSVCHNQLYFPKSCILLRVTNPLLRRMFPPPHAWQTYCYKDHKKHISTFSFVKSAGHPFPMQLVVFSKNLKEPFLTMAAVIGSKPSALRRLESHKIKLIKRCAVLDQSQ